MKCNWLSIKVANAANGPLSLWTEYKCTVVVLNTCVPFINNMSIATGDWRLREIPHISRGYQSKLYKERKKERKKKMKRKRMQNHTLITFLPEHVDENYMLTIFLLITGNNTLHIWII